MPSLYEIDSLDVFFSSTHALKKVSLSVSKGEFLGIIGPNGSGKSTLMRTMAGVVRPSHGSVRLEGRDVAAFSGRELAGRLAVVPQESQVSFDFSVLEIVLMGRSPHLGRFQMESDRDIEIAFEALERTNLLNLAERKIGELSGGERQRAMIARALAQRTDILFLDEPTAHLDINYQIEILQLARRENVDSGTTVVAVLHDLNLASEFCDRLVFLRDGQLFASGEPAEIITAENVLTGYGASVWVRKHPTSGRPYVLSIGHRGPMPRVPASLEVSGKPFTVHVICGGGSGAQIFTNLLDSSCAVTAGVINIGDTDQEAAESLGIEYVEDAPFSPISESAQVANFELARRADAIVVADTPFGSGNITNLHSVLTVAQAGIPVAIVGSRDGFEARDFMQGEVKSALEELVEHGASVLDTPTEVAGWVAKTRWA